MDSQSEGRPSSIAFSQTSLFSSHLEKGSSIFVTISLILSTLVISALFKYSHLTTGYLFDPFGTAMIPSLPLLGWSLEAFFSSLLIFFLVLCNKFLSISNPYFSYILNRKGGHAYIISFSYFFLSSMLVIKHFNKRFLFFGDTIESYRTAAMRTYLWSTFGSKLEW